MPGPLEAVPIDAFRQQFEVNVIGVVAVTQAFLPLIRKARGRLVNISSLNGGLSLPYMGAYSASKFALEGAQRRAASRTVSLEDPRRAGGAGTDRDAHLEQIGGPGRRNLPRRPRRSAIALQKDLASLRRTVGRIAGKASPVDRVVRAVVHALTADRPKIRYFLGFRVRFLLQRLSHGPRSTARFDCAKGDGAFVELGAGWAGPRHNVERRGGRGAVRSWRCRIAIR